VAEYLTFVVPVAQVFLPLIGRLTLWSYPTIVSHMEAVLLILNALRKSMGDVVCGAVQWKGVVALRRGFGGKAVKQSSLIL
jgi:hypothetical protein